MNHLKLFWLILTGRLNIDYRHGRARHEHLVPATVRHPYSRIR